MYTGHSHSFEIQNLNKSGGFCEAILLSFLSEEFSSLK